MARFERHDRAIRYIEYWIPSGDYVDEFNKAWNAAMTKWRELNGDRDPAGDWCQIVAGDEHVIIRITDEQVK